MEPAFDLATIGASFDKEALISLVSTVGGGVIAIALVVKGFQLVKRMIGRV